jgi:isoleucyl-tRNA synthetase
VLSAELLAHVEKVFTERGADAWFTDAAEVLPESIRCPSCGDRPREGFTRDASIIDVWFESGSSFCAVCADDPDLGAPVDLYLEGSDQHRGWFHSSLLVGCAVLGEAPYRAVLTHGFVCDETGRAYSKTEIRRRQEERQSRIVTRVQAGEDLGSVLADLESTWARPEKLAEASGRLLRGTAIEALVAEIAASDIEYIPPETVVKEQGAEILRAWAAFVDYENDMPYSRAHLGQVADAYRKVRNTFRFLLGALREGHAPDLHEVSLEPLDRWALDRLGEVLACCENGYRRYDFRRVFTTLVDFLQDLSGFYLDASKDWLYNDPPESPRRRSACASIQCLARTLAIAMAPILPFTAEDVWDHLKGPDGKAASIHLETWPRVPGMPGGSELRASVARLRTLREAIFAEVEPHVQAWGQEKQAAKRDGRDPGAGGHALPEEVRIDHPRDAWVMVTLPAGEIAALGEMRDVASEVLCFGSLDLREGEALVVSVCRAPGEACDRCRRRRPDVGDDGLCTRCREAVGRHESSCAT